MITNAAMGSLRRNVAIVMRQLKIDMITVDLVFLNAVIRMV